MKKQRNWIPCHQCGKEHTNPASSSCCVECNKKLKAEGELRAQKEKEIEDERRLRKLTTEEALDRLLDVVEDLTNIVSAMNESENRYDIKEVYDRLYFIRDNHQV